MGVRRECDLRVRECELSIYPARRRATLHSRGNCLPMPSSVSPRVRYFLRNWQDRMSYQICLWPDILRKSVP